MKTLLLSLTVMMAASFAHANEVCGRISGSNGSYEISSSSESEGYTANERLSARLDADIAAGRTRVCVEYRGERDEYGDANNVIVSVQSAR